MSLKYGYRNPTGFRQWVVHMSVNMDIRILWRYESGTIILLLEIGHHKDILGV